MIGGIFSVASRIITIAAITKDVVEGVSSTMENLCSEFESDIEYISDSDVEILGVRPRTYESERVYMYK